MVKLSYLPVGCFLLLCCRGSAASEELLARYAGANLANPDNYLLFYSQGLKLDQKTQSTGKMRAFLLAAMAEPDLKNPCAKWDCIPAGLKALEAKQRSRLYSYAVYHLADLAQKQNNFADAMAILSLVADMPLPLERKVSLLKGKLLQFTNPAAAPAHFRDHAQKHGDAESLYFSAAALQLSGDKKGAVEIALRVLDKPEADFPFAQSGLIIRDSLGGGIYALGDTNQRIRLMEALRVAKDRTSAQKLFQLLLAAKLPGDDQRLFTHYGARLAIDRGDYRAVAQLIGKNSEDFLADGHDKQALDICERLLKKKQFVLAESLFPLAPATKSRLQCRLRLAQRAGQMNADARAVAAQYIEKFDEDSTLAERVFLRSCLPEAKARTAISIECLEELRRVTNGKPVGAGARYYLARHYANAGDAAKVSELMRELAAGYADDYYFYRLTDRPLPIQKTIAASGGSRNDKIFAALVSGDLDQAKDVGELAELKSLAKKVEALTRNIDAEKQIALLLVAGDSRDEAREIMRGGDRLSIFEVLIAFGIVADKSDISLFGVKQWMREKKLRPFLYEIPPYLLAQLYPTTYAAHVEKYAAKHRLEKAEVMALIRQESQFFPGAISIAQAQGLMQILPATARLVAAKEGLRNYNLLKAEDNIRLGTSFMRDIKDNYTADYVGLAIAYNAGPGRYMQWKRKLSSDDDIFIEEIPFQETYQYVRILLVDRAKYRVLMK